MVRLFLILISLLGGIDQLAGIGSALAEGRWETSVFAGTGKKGYSGDGGQATAAMLNNPYGLVRGPDHAIYACDIDNHVIRRIDRKGVILTVAGNGAMGYSGDGGLATAAELNQPYEIRFDGTGNMFFVEMPNHVIRRVDAATGIISTMAGTGVAGFSGDGGVAVAASLSRPHSIQFSPDGKGLFVCDIGNHRVRRIDLSSGVIGTFVGDGKKRLTPDGARFFGQSVNGPRAADFDADGHLWLALREGNAIYRLDIQNQTFHHEAGTGEKGFTGNGGAAREATLSGPKGIAVGPNGDVYFADTESHTIRFLDRSEGTIELLLGTGQRGADFSSDPLRCETNRPHGIFVDGDGSVFVGDSENHRVIRVYRIN
jgi:sugar lactone lactonase YvrE